MSPRLLAGLFALSLCGVALCSAGAQEAESETIAPQSAETSADQHAPAESSAPAEAPAWEPAPAEAAAAVVDTIPVVSKTAAEPEPEKDDGAAHLDDITVTATKREAGVRSMAGTVSALSGEDLADMGAQDIEDIVKQVPGVNLVDEKSGGSPNSVKRITIRGIAAGMNQVDTVGVFLDETSLTDPFQPQSSADVNPFDIGQVEVLKGPVGTLFGGSALNGAIRYIPTAPMLGEWQGTGFAEWRTFKDGGSAPIFGAMANVPLGDEAALRIAGIERETAGYVDSVNPSYMAKDVNGTDQSTLRAIARWMPLSQLDLSLMYLHQDTLSKDFSTVTADRGGRYESTASPQPSPTYVDYDLWQLKGSWAFDWADLVAIASKTEKYLAAVYDQSSTASNAPPASLLYTEYDSTGGAVSQEVRLVSPAGGEWEWIAGLYNSRFKIDFFGYVTSGEGTLPPALGGIPLPLPLLNASGVVVGYTDYSGTVGEQAGFGELSWRFLPDWQLTGGLRAYQFAYDLRVRFDGPICVTTDPACVADGLHSDQPLRNKERGLSPKLSLKWDASDQVMAYATAANGFRFGGINPLAHPEIPPTYESDSLWSYEIGTRTQWFDRTLIADFTAFYIDWDNAQFQTLTSDGTFGYTDNVGAVVGHGLEGQLVWLTPLPGVKLTTIAAYADIVTAEDYVKPGVAGSTTTPAGKRWPRAPEWQTTASLDWTHVFGAVEVGAGATHAYLGKALQNFGLASDVEIFGYSTWSAQFTAKPLQDDWWPDFALNVNNITNKQGLNYLYDGAGEMGAKTRTYTAPRNVSVRFTFSF